MWAIRYADPSDLASLIDLAQRCHGDVWSREVWAEAMARPSSRIGFVEAVGSVPVGFMVARRIGDLLEIDLLGVAPESRRRGAAAFLLESAIAAEWARGMNEVRLELRESNDTAQRLYTRLGFVVVGQRSRYYPDGEKALLLTRRC